MMCCVIGCDIGSQAVKTVLVSEAGKVLGEASCSYPTRYPQPSWAEQDHADWIESLQQAVDALLKKTGISPGQVYAIGLDAQVDGMVAVDRDGQPLYPAMIWMDRR